MKKYLLLMFTLFLTSASFSQTKLTLEEAIQIALQRNSALVKAKYNLETSKANVKSAYGDLLPNFGLSAGWDWSKTEDPGIPNITAADTYDSRGYSVGAGGSVTLFNGLANYANINSAELEDEAAILSIDRFKRDLVQTTTIYYYSILRSKALLKVKEENFKYNNKLLETISERNRLGSAPIADVYAQQVQAGSAEVEMITAKNNVDAAQNTLINFLALDILNEYDFISTIDNVSDKNIYNKEFSNILEMVEYALANRTDFISQKKTLLSTEEGITMANAGFWPSVSGRYNFSSSAGAVDELFDRRVWGLSLDLNIPIFSNFNTETQVQVAKVRNLSAQEDLSALERQIKIEIKQGFLDFQAVSKALEVAQKTVVSASENKRIQYERYNIGSGTFLDVLQSDRDYQNALALKIDAEFNFHSSREALMNSLGKLEYSKYEK
jgi:outer membrane protein